MQKSKSKTKRKVFITGGCGFIGSNLVKHLLDRGGFDITVYDNLSVSSRDNLARAITDSKKKGCVKFIKGDILDRDRLNRLTRRHDAIIHLAAHTRVLESLKDPAENFTTNSIGTFNSLEAARRNRIGKFIFASSNAAVGEQVTPINECMVPKPISPYGASKLCGEALCMAYFSSYGIKTLVLRFANAYGPYSFHKTSVVAKFIKKLKVNRSLEVYGDGNQTRDFIHADDVCRAIYRSLMSDLGGETFQIATGVPTRIRDLASLTKECIGNSKTRLIFTKRKKGEILKNHSDIRKAKTMLAFRPKISLYRGMRQLTEKK